MSMPAERRRPSRAQLRPSSRVQSHRFLVAPIDLLEQMVDDHLCASTHGQHGFVGRDCVGNGPDIGAFTMRLGMHSARIFLTVLTSVVCVSAGSAALAQAHQSTSGPCTLRSSTVDSGSIAASIAAKRGFSPAADLAIVNVTVRRSTLACRAPGDSSTMTPKAPSMATK